MVMSWYTYGQNHFAVLRMNSVSREHDSKGQLFDWEDHGSVELPVDRALSLGFLSYILRVDRASLDQSQSRNAKQKWRAGGPSHLSLEQIQDVFPIHVNISQYPALETHVEVEEHETK